MRPQDLFGPDLDAVLRDAETDPAAARCQVAAARSLAKIAAAKMNAFNACKSDAGLRRGAIRSAADLAALPRRDDRAGRRQAVAKGQQALAKAVRGVDLAAALPGRCGARR